MIKHDLKQIQTSRETDIRPFGGDLSDKTLFQKKSFKNPSKITSKNGFQKQQRGRGRSGGLKESERIERKKTRFFKCRKQP